MAKTLDDAIKEANIDRAKRFPLLDINTNIEEIREIAQRAIPYVHEMCPDLMEPEPWEFTTQIVMQLLRATFGYLNKRKSTEFKEVYLNLGTLMKVSICYGETKTGDKVGTFNPAIEVGRDLDYAFREEPYNDAMSNDMAQELEAAGMKYLHPMFYDVRKEFHEICETTKANIQANYQIKVTESDSLSYVLVAFFRKAKEWLIEHKDDNDGYGAEFSLGRLIDMGIEKHADESYFIYLTPSPEFKMDNAKGDDKTEKQNREDN